MPRAITRATSSRRAWTTLARNGSPSAGFIAIWESSARMTGPNGVSVIARMALVTAASSSARVSPVSSMVMCGAASCISTSSASASLDGQRR